MPPAPSFDDTCKHLFDAYPLSIGIAFKELDCGCALLCAVSAQGNPIGPMEQASGRNSTPGHSKTICLRCKKDNGLSRVVSQGIIWPGTIEERPTREIRLSIGCSVFGENYSE